MITSIFASLYILVIGFLVMTLFGYLVHWLLHQTWSGRLNHAHMTHHLRLYPTSDYLSDTYREAGKDNTVIMFFYFAIPLILFPAVLYVVHIISLVSMILLFVEIFVVGKLHDYFHDSFHIRHHPLKKYAFFNTWTDIHFVHHLDMQKNFGIFFFGWDALFGSWQSVTPTTKAPTT